MSNAQHPHALHLGRYLRVDDNPLLAHAAQTQDSLLPVFAMDPSVQRSPHQEAFLLASLADMQSSLRALGSDLLLVHEAPPDNVRDLYNEPLRMIDDTLLPFDIAAMPRTYTPFRQRVEAAGVRTSPPIDPVTSLPPLPDGVMCPTIVVPDAPMIAHGGEGSARAHWQQYRDRRLPDSYKQTRNGLLGWDYSSKLSPWLAWGCISPRRIATDLAAYEAQYGANDGTYWLWFELMWRDFFALRGEHRTHDHHAVDRMINTAGNHWQMMATASTGNSFVDAGLRELNATGFLGNRMRQIVASYCMYERNIPWQVGEAYFAMTLIDYDPASNVGNWSYIAGSGADPRGGRRFSVEKQREMYDADGAYTRTWSAQR